MSSPWVIVGVTVGIIALSALFVAVEFALLAARRHRLEDLAATSRSARAALRSYHELTVLLAGAQLGITACTLALGAVTKPAVHHWITPAIEDLGAEYWVADVLGFVLALIVVTFLHLVIGEMMPKSWAIAHPETASIALALPMRAFMAVTRPALTGLNEAANAMLRRVGVDPVDQASNGQNVDGLKHLVEHSVDVGALDSSYSDQLSSALALRRTVIRDLVTEPREPTAVARDATVSDVQAAAERSGHLRILIGSDERTGTPVSVLHVRDTLLERPDRRADDLARPAFVLDGSTALTTAIAQMRETRNHLALVRDAEEIVGVIPLTDVLNRLLVGNSGGTNREGD